MESESKSKFALVYLLLGVVVFIALVAANISLFRSQREHGREKMLLEEQLVERLESLEVRDVLSQNQFYRNQLNVNYQLLKALAPEKMTANGFDFSAVTAEDLKQLKSNLMVLPLDRRSLDRFQVHNTNYLAALTRNTALPTAPIKRWLKKTKRKESENGLAVYSQLPGDTEAILFVERFQFATHESVESWSVKELKRLPSFEELTQQPVLERWFRIAPPCSKKPSLVETAKFQFESDSRYFIIAAHKEDGDSLSELVLRLSKPNEPFVELGRFPLPLDGIPIAGRIFFYHADLVREHNAITTRANAWNLVEPNEDGVWLNVFLDGATTSFCRPGGQLDFVTVRLVIRSK